MLFIVEKRFFRLLKLNVLHTKKKGTQNGSPLASLSKPLFLSVYYMWNMIKWAQRQLTQKLKLQYHLLTLKSLFFLLECIDIYCMDIFQNIFFCVS